MISAERERERNGCIGRGLEVLGPRHADGRTAAAAGALLWSVFPGPIDTPEAEGGKVVEGGCLAWGGNEAVLVKSGGSREVVGQKEITGQGGHNTVRRPWVGQVEAEGLEDQMDVEVRGFRRLWWVQEVRRPRVSGRWWWVGMERPCMGWRDREVMVRPWVGEIRGVGEAVGWGGG